MSCKREQGDGLGGRNIDFACDFHPYLLRRRRQSRHLLPREFLGSQVLSPVNPSDRFLGAVLTNVGMRV